MKFLYILLLTISTSYAYGENKPVSLHGKSIYGQKTKLNFLPIQDKGYKIILTVFKEDAVNGRSYHSISLGEGWRCEMEPKQSIQCSRFNGEENLSLYTSPSEDGKGLAVSLESELNGVMPISFKMNWADKA